MSFFSIAEDTFCYFFEWPLFPFVGNESKKSEREERNSSWKRMGRVTRNRKLSVKKRAKTLIWYTKE